jgi:hypothetical protein
VAIQTMERELLSMPKFIGVRSERAKAPKPKHVDRTCALGILCSQKPCALGRVFSHNEPLDFCAAGDHRDARHSELLVAPLKKGQ